MRPTRFLLVLLPVYVLAGCGDDGGPVSPDDGGTETDSGAPMVDGSPADAGDVDPLVVRVEQGDARGFADGDLRVFLGIPYAAPPVGPLRFRPPEPAVAFDGVLDASSHGPVCPQEVREGVRPTGTLEGDEDCLKLNVWAHPEGAPRPVMVFVHGGGFQTGSGSEPTYDGASLARAGDVVVVTLNYRLGVLGLLATEQLAAESGEDSAGNYGIRDQIFALSWLRRNLPAFGGDPDQVTIFGESAGAVSVCVLMGSPMADGLFGRGVIQSGGGCHGLPGLRSPGATSRMTAMDRGAEIVADAGCDGATDELACMRALPADTLVRAGAMGSTTGLGIPDFSPNIDGVVITADTYALFERGERDLPFVIGSNADEATMFTLGVPVPTEAAFRTLARSMLGAVADDVLALYPVTDYPSPKAAFNAAFGEIGFVCPAVAMTRVGAAGPEPVWAYHFTHVLETGILRLLGAFHGLELAYVFGNYPDTYTPTADDLRLRDTAQRAWTSFAQTGAPEVTPPWPAYTTSEPAFFVLDEPAAVVDEIVEGRCAELARLGVVPGG